MKLGINQAYFLPYLGFFQLIASVDKFMLYEHVSFRKRSWMTRNRILKYGPAEPMNIQLSVAARSSYTLIREIKLADNHANNVRRILRQIQFNYARAPYFTQTFALLTRLLGENSERRLHDFNAHLIRGICDHLSISTQISHHHPQYLSLEAALEEMEDDGSPIDRKTRRVLRICAAESATSFVNLPGGQALYDPALFADHGLELRFMKMSDHSYPQFRRPFSPQLSIVDVLMHCGPDRGRELIYDYRFV